MTEPYSHMSAYAVKVIGVDRSSDSARKVKLALCGDLSGRRFAACRLFVNADFGLRQRV